MKRLLIILLIFGIAVPSYGATTVRRAIEPETLTFNARVAADSGTIIDSFNANWTTRVFKDYGVWGNLLTATSSQWGVKKDGSNTQSVFYSLNAATGDATQSTGANQGTWTANQQGTKAGTVFTAASKHYYTLGTNLGKPANFSLIVVAKVTDVTTVQLLLGSSDAAATGAKRWGEVVTKVTNNGDLFYIFSNGTYYSYGLSGVGTISSNTTFLHSQVYSNGTDHASLYKNGSLLSVTEVITTATANSGTAENYSIGRSGDNDAFYFGGTLFVHMVFNTPLSDTQRQAIEAAINAYWAVY